MRQQQLTRDFFTIHANAFIWLKSDIGYAHIRCLMSHIKRIVLVVALFAGVGSEAGSTEVTDEASAIAAAKRYTKARCAVETPCTFKARREGKQWNVWVEFTKRNRPGDKPQPYPGGYVLLYFDAEGYLVRRVEGQ
jgi:hypothetical protein